MSPPSGRRPRAAATARRSGGRHAVEPAGERVGHVARVAAEGLVAAVAVERHGDVPAGQLGEVEARDRRRVGERLAVVADDLRQRARSPRRGPGTPRGRCRSARRRGGRAAARRTARRRSRSRTSAPARSTGGPSPRRRRRSRSRRTGTRRAARRRSCACGSPRAAPARIRSHSSSTDSPSSLLGVVELPVAADLGAAVADHQRVAGGQLVHAAKRRASAPGRSRGRGRRRSPRGRPRAGSWCRRAARPSPTRS